MMSKKQDRLDIVESIKIAAELYKEKLVGRSFLYVFDGRYIEVIFKRENFRHLTGVESSLSANQFYKNAVRRQLTASQIYFTDRHPYQLCKKKVQHICSIAILATSECIMLEEISTATRFYKFGTTDLNFTLCMNIELNGDGQPKGSCYVVESLRDGDSISKSKSAYEVTHIFSMSNDMKKYTDVLFVDRKESIASVPATVRLLLSDELLGQPISPSPHSD